MKTPIKNLIPMALALTFVSSVSMASSLDFTVTTCEQKCGFTENTSTSLWGRALNQADAVSILRSKCRWSGMALQGEPTCGHEHYDQRINEDAVRCAHDVGDYCYVIVIGDGKDPNAGLVSANFEAHSESYRKSEAEAKRSCDLHFKGLGASEYRCEVTWYAPTWKP